MRPVLCGVHFGFALAVVADVKLPNELYGVLGLVEVEVWELLRNVLYAKVLVVERAAGSIVDDAGPVETGGPTTALGKADAVCVTVMVVLCR
jgi:hypothetical protein